MEQAISVGVGFDRAWYRSQKEHWLGWLTEYHGAGACGRSAQPPRNARYVYNHIQCGPMLFWLAEALGMETVRLDAAFGAVTDFDVKGAPQCAALRHELHWKVIEGGLTDWPYRRTDRFRIRIPKKAPYVVDLETHANAPKKLERSS
jgi:hypothetical protein